MLSWTALTQSIKSKVPDKVTRQIKEWIWLSGGSDACEMASPKLWWIAEQQECLHGSLQQIMSITHCVENPSPLFSFTPQQKTNGPHSLPFGWGVNYRPLPIWTATSDNGLVRPPTQESLPGLLCWYHLLMRGHWHLNLIYAQNTIKAFGTKTVW